MPGDSLRVKRGSCLPVIDEPSQGNKLAEIGARLERAEEFGEEYPSVCARKEPRPWKPLGNLLLFQAKLLLGVRSPEGQQPYRSQERLPLSDVARLARKAKRLPLPAPQEHVATFEPALDDRRLTEKRTPRQLVRAHADIMQMKFRSSKRAVWRDSRAANARLGAFLALDRGRLLTLENELYVLSRFGGAARLAGPANCP